LQSRREKFSGVDKPNLASIKFQIFQIRNINGIFNIRCGVLKYFIDKCEVLSHCVRISSIDRNLRGSGNGGHFEMKQPLRTVVYFGSYLRKSLSQECNEPQDG
jgi:hypothetical protein